MKFSEILNGLQYLTKKTRWRERVEANETRGLD